MAENIVLVLALMAIGGVIGAGVWAIARAVFDA